MTITPATGMKGDTPRTESGKLKALHGNTKIETVEDSYRRDYFPGMPSKSVITISDLRQVCSSAKGKPVIGVKEMRRICIILSAPHVPFIALPSFELL